MRNSVVTLLTFLTLFGSSCKKDSNTTRISGCTDPMSITYNEFALTDDGSCVYAAFNKKVLVIKGTGQRCLPCGKYGVPLSDSLLKVFPDIDLVTIHYNDDFQSSSLDCIKKDLGNGGIPFFNVGKEVLRASPDLVFARVQDELNREPQVQLFTTFEIRGNEMSIDVVTRKIPGTKREFNIAIYILEDNQIGPQLGQPILNYEHNHVLRKVLDDKTFGIPIIYDGVSSSSHFTINLEEIYSTEKQPIVPANCYPIAVIWEKRVYGFEFVNVGS